MSTDPDQIRGDIAVLLSHLPDLSGEGGETPDLEAVAAGLDHAHNLLVRALESVEKG
ncbi:MULTISPECIES: hypothetical protein [unclassified Mycolicibacterium]|uniref:hypothetical protein n=1 Tax=unclassified Mycolicibacterium TaxID=2636767 RepID=UPI0014124A2D|nr:MULTISPECIES: hypothetical protein [unclassified Mycolicibacterium]